MNLKFFIIFTFFIQFGFSQDSLIEKLTDTIIVDKNCVRQLNKVVLEIDTSNLFLEDKESDTAYINLLFINKTKSSITISRIRGGSNYYCDDRGDVTLFPNDKKSIKMILGVRNSGIIWVRTLSFYLSRGDIKSQKVNRQHTFRLINLKKKRLK